MKTPAIVTLALVVGVAIAGRAMQRSGQDMLAAVDHLVYATPDLALGIETLERLLGVRATPGGQHPGLGTRNALIALGPSSYLEIIGPDPDQPKPATPRRFGIDELTAPRLTTWVAKGKDLDRLVSRARGAGVMLGDVTAGSRKRPDGVVLSWRYTDPTVVLVDRLIPYVIDWGASPHPAATAAPGVKLVGLRAEHADAARVQTMFTQLGFELPVRAAATPALIATLEGRKGRVELSSR